MTLPTFPSNQMGLAFPFRWSVQFFNMPSAIASSGASIDIGLAQYPLHTFELTWEVLRDFVGTPTEFKQLLAFWIQMGGTIGRFAFFNPDDNTVTGGAVGTGDGSTTVFGPILRYVPLTGVSDPVGLIGTLVAVYFNGGAPISSSLYTLTGVPGAQTITFGTAPANTTVITADFIFYYYCRFAENIMQFEKFSNLRWLVQKATIVSCRAGA